MSREILFYGPLFYGHRLGRYFCPDDLDCSGVKKREPSCSRFYFAVLPAALARGGQQTIRAEHRLDTADRLARTVPVLDQREADVGITIVAKANPRRDANLRFIKQLFANSSDPMAA